ncbi:hypothetical protein D3C86_2266330 [compost metagenome]
MEANGVPKLRGVPLFLAKAVNSSRFLAGKSLRTTNRWGEYAGIAIGVNSFCGL